MDLFANLILGFSVAGSLTNLLYCMAGALVGTLVGVLPGIGPFVAIALLLPATYTLEPAPALIMLAGIYYGASYGGSTTAILVNLPGESSSVVTCLDGHAMAKQGRAGPALAIAAIGSFVAGCVATMVIVLFAPPLVKLALKFGSPEYFSLVVLGLISAVVLARGSVLKAIAMSLVGVFLGMVGIDLNSSVPRFTFGMPQLSDGLSFVVIAMGVFGIGEIIANLQYHGGGHPVLTTPIGRLMPSIADLRQSWKAILRGTAIGSLFGVLPGAGPTISSFASYMVEKKLAKDPERFGQGAIEGVAGPEAANNAASQTAFIPTLTLGIPGTATMVLILGALWIQGILPGPKLMVEKPELFWGLIASMWIGNLMLLVLNLPMIGLWARLATVPYRLLFPAIILFICIGAYSLNNSAFDVAATVLFGVLGYVMVLLGFEGAPLLLGFVLGPMLEENLRRSLIISRGDPTVFFTRPISLGLLLAALFLLLLIVAPSFRRKREEIFVE